jgi:hypothetical protein
MLHEGCEIVIGVAEGLDVFAGFQVEAGEHVEH